MSRRLFALGALLGGVLIVPVHAARAPAEAATILRVEQERIAALVNDDFGALDRLLADDLTYAHSSTLLENKAGYLVSLRTGALKYTSLVHESQQVRLYGDTAVLTGLSTVQALSHGKPSTVKLRFLTVDVQRRGQWALVGWQSTRLP